MPPVCPPLDPNKPPTLSPRHAALFAADPLLSRRVLGAALLRGDPATAGIAAWHLSQFGAYQIRDTILHYTIESIGSAEPVLVELMRGAWGALRPAGHWDALAEWPLIAKTLQTLAAAPTGLGAIDLLIHCVSPSGPGTPFDALRQVRRLARKRILKSADSSAVERLAAAFALADTTDPLWSPLPAVEGGSTFELMGVLAGLGTPECLLESVHFCPRDQLSAPALAHALVSTFPTDQSPVAIPGVTDTVVAEVEAAWQAGGAWGAADLPDVFGLPLAAFRLPSSFGPAAMEAALLDDPGVLFALKAVTDAEPVEIVDTVLKRADRRLLMRELAVPALPQAAVLGDLGAFADVGVGPGSIGSVVALVRGVLPVLATVLEQRLKVLS